MVLTATWHRNKRDGAPMLPSLCQLWYSSHPTVTPFASPDQQKATLLGYFFYRFIRPSQVITAREDCWRTALCALLCLLVVALRYLHSALCQSSFSSLPSLSHGYLLSTVPTMYLRSGAFGGTLCNAFHRLPAPSFLKVAFC